MLNAPLYLLRATVAIAAMIAPMMMVSLGAQELPALTDEMLGRSGAVLHVEIQKSVPFDRGRGNLSATHTATVRAAVQGELKPGQTIEFIEEGKRHKRYDPPASHERIVLLSYSRSTQDGQMKWWLHDRVNYGYSEAGFATLKADVARVRAAQADKAARDASK